MNNKLTLEFIGYDDEDRATYKTPEGQLVCDVENLGCHVPHGSIGISIEDAVQVDTWNRKYACLHVLTSSEFGEGQRDGLIRAGFEIHFI